MFWGCMLFLLCFGVEFDLFMFGAGFYFHYVLGLNVNPMTIDQLGLILDPFQGSNPRS